MKEAQVCIVGAGVSGLVCALELERAGFAPVLAERSERLGGRVGTDLVGGIPLDHGFQVLLTAYPAARRYLDYAALDLRRFQPGAVIFANGKGQRFGDFLRHPGFLLPTLSSDVGSLRDKWRMFRLNRQLGNRSLDALFSGTGGSTMAYLQERFGPRIIERFFRPFFGGIFLDTALATPAAMFEFGFKMFAEGSAAIPAGGMQQIAEHLAGQLERTQIRLRQEMEHLEGNTLHFTNGDQLTCEAVVLAGDIIMPLSANSDVQWRGCTTHYFHAENDVLRAPIIGLIADEPAVVNTFHYVTALVGTPNRRHVLSATVIDGAETVDPERVIADLESYAGVQGLQHLRSFQLPRSLPDLSQLSYAPSTADVRERDGVYRAGDITANGSLNAAMESGRVAAEAVLEDLN